MLTPAATAVPEAPMRIYAALSDTAEPSRAADAAAFLRTQLDAAAAQPPCLPVRYDELAGWIAHHAQTATDAYHRYQVVREFGAPRRHFATLAQARQFLREAAPARLADGASLYGVVERWDDVDFQPMIASYLEQLGNGVPDRNRYLLYRDLLASGAGSASADAGAGGLSVGLPLASYRSAALELSLAHNGDDFLPELIGYNLARQQPSAELLVARHELTELGLHADAFAGAGVAAGSGPSALLSLRGVMARVGDPAAFYRRVADGFRLHAQAAHLPLPSAGDAAAPLPAESSAAAPAGAPAGRPAAAAANAATAATAARQAGSQPAPVLPPDTVANRAPGRSAQAVPAPLPVPDGPADAGGPKHQGSQLATADAPRRVRAERPVIRHHFPADEHAWESIGCELRLLEARLASSDSKEEAMATLSRLLAPALQHTPAGLMAARIYTQLFNL
ncbi:hypothetical protein ASC94_02410 [Massilia sp. Root418]|uniref:iron-containing redox enzyme family protein n=1 Tax=Massilia sp. Root418 TaxID=1736532 RepID=UPI0006F47386|nr:iron-containing redox enzyme family protein [Massilia sp. Root418]KQX01494.1 hypothetical protein ASC94_02410 [Massilia sp. Root418]